MNRQAPQVQPTDAAATQESIEVRRRSRRRVRTLKHLLIFQVKLGFEGLKDILLGPLSLMAAVVDLLLAKDAPNRYLDDVMRLGQRFEDWLGLYSINDPTAEQGGAVEGPQPQPQPGGRVTQGGPAPVIVAPGRAEGTPPSVGPRA